MNDRIEHTSADRIAPSDGSRLNHLLLSSDLKENVAAVVEKYLVQTDGPIVCPEDLELGLYSSQGTNLGMKLSEWEEQQSKVKISYIRDTIETAGSKSEVTGGCPPAQLEVVISGDV